MSGESRTHRMLYGLQRFVCFFLVVGMIVTCCMTLFVSRLQEEMNLIFTEADIQRLYDEIRERCPFEEEHDFIRISKMPSHNITVGISLPYIHAFLDEAGVELDGGK